MTDIFWSIIIIAVYYQVFKRLLNIGKKVKREVELDETEKSIS